MFVFGCICSFFLDHDGARVEFEVDSISRNLTRIFWPLIVICHRLCSEDGASIESTFEKTK